MNMFYVYILANTRNGTIYVGSTDDLARRVLEHRDGVRAGFTKRHALHRLVWWEAHHSRDSAFRRERRIKEWRRTWKLMLIEAGNPTWRDLYGAFMGAETDPDAWLAALTSAGSAP